MSRPSVLLDEDVPVALGEALRGRGHDAVHVYETDLGGREDADILSSAVGLRRAVLTGRRHFGVIVAAQVPFKTLLARASRLLSNRDAESLMDAVVWLAD